MTSRDICRVISMQDDDDIDDDDEDDDEYGDDDDEEDDEGDDDEDVETWQVAVARGCAKGQPFLDFSSRTP